VLAPPGKNPFGAKPYPCDRGEPARGHVRQSATPDPKPGPGCAGPPDGSPLADAQPPGPPPTADISRVQQVARACRHASPRPCRPAESANAPAPSGNHRPQSFSQKGRASG